MNNKGLFIKISASVCVLFVLIIFIVSYNSMVKKEEQVLGSWSQVESVLQRKVDLIPNLVKTVQAYAQHEKEVLLETTKARNVNMQAILSELQENNQKLKSLSANGLPGSENLANINAINKKLDANIFKLMAISESYPNLKASTNFLSLQAQLEGSENRINVTRMHFNNSVSDYNAYIRTMPANMIAGMSGFTRKAYFKADKDAHEKFDVTF